MLAAMVAPLSSRQLKVPPPATADSASCSFHSLGVWVGGEGDDKQHVRLYADTRRRVFPNGGPVSPKYWPKRGLPLRDATGDVTGGMDPISSSPRKLHVTHRRYTTL